MALREIDAKRAGREVPPITRHPERLGGTPTIAGTRLPVEALLDYLWAGKNIDEFLEDFPGVVTREEVQAALDRIKEGLGLIAEDVDY
jgi:uncharacterized protein (DUF433 family)